MVSPQAGPTAKARISAVHSPTAAVSALPKQWHPLALGQQAQCCNAVIGVGAVLHQVNLLLSTQIRPGRRKLPQEASLCCVKLGRPAGGINVGMSSEA
eukprot:scaffold169675_cov30-Prasinocladus_malaysianus.AAC.1